MIEKLGLLFLAFLAVLFCVWLGERMVKRWRRARRWKKGRMKLPCHAWLAFVAVLNVDRALTVDLIFSLAGLVLLCWVLRLLLRPVKRCGCERCQEKEQGNSTLECQATAPRPTFISDTRRRLAAQEDAFLLAMRRQEERLGQQRRLRDALPVIEAEREHPPWCDCLLHRRLVRNGVTDHAEPRISRMARMTDEERQAGCFGDTGGDSTLQRFNDSTEVLP